MEKPKILSNDQIDLNNLKKSCQEALDNCSNEDGDFEHYVYESAMIALFGEKIFDYINSKID